MKVEKVAKPSPHHIQAKNEGQQVIHLGGGGAEVQPRHI